MSHATSLPEVSPEALAAFRDKSDAIIRETVNRSLERTDEVAHHGDEAERLITVGLQFTTRMLDSAMELGEPAILEDQLTWAMERLPHDGVAPEHVLSRLRIYADVVETLLPAQHAQEINSVVRWMIGRQQELMQEKGSG